MSEFTNGANHVEDSQMYSTGKLDPTIQIEQENIWNFLESNHGSTYEEWAPRPIHPSLEKYIGSYVSFNIKAIEQGLAEKLQISPYLSYCVDHAFYDSSSRVILEIGFPRNRYINEADGYEESEARVHIAASLLDIVEHY